MKIAIATEDFEQVSGHAGQSRYWLLYEIGPEGEIGLPLPVSLTREQVFHHWTDTGPHPLDGVSVIVARSAGDGFLRRMKQRGVEVVLTGETEAKVAIEKLRSGETLLPAGWEASLLLCKLRDLFSRH